MFAANCNTPSCPKFCTNVSNLMHAIHFQKEKAPNKPIIGVKLPGSGVKYQFEKSRSNSKFKKSKNFKNYFWPTAEIVIEKLKNNARSFKINKNCNSRLKIVGYFFLVFQKHYIFIEILSLIKSQSTKTSFLLSILFAYKDPFLQPQTLILIRKCTPKKPKTN